jgi:hypothetical protein
MMDLEALDGGVEVVMAVLSNYYISKMELRKEAL